DFALANLEQYDAIILNNTAGMLTEDKQLQQDLLDYVYAGGGLIGTHAAGATFCQYPNFDLFPEFGDLLGGFESGGHPWKPHEYINLKMDDPDHPANLAFGGKNFEVSDEVFQFKDPWSRNRVRVLNSVDAAYTDMSPKRQMLPERRADQDFAISWVKNYGRGKVFYTSLGHNNHLFWNTPILQQLLDAIQFVTGDLKGPTTPSAKLTPAVEAQEKLGWNFGIAAYTFKNNTLFETIEKVDQLGLAYVGGLNVQKVSADIPKNFDHHLSDMEIRQVRRKLDEHGITMLTYFVFDIPGDEAECRSIFEFGKKMGIRTFISEPKLEDLDKIEKFCEEYQIKLAIHNHGPRLSPVYMYPEKIAELTKSRSPLIGAACDFGHWAKEGIDPYKAVKILGDRVITIQMHDQSQIDAEGHDVPWGKGAVELDKILQFLKDEKIKPVMFGLEYSYNWDHSWQEVRESIGFFNSQSLKLANQ
ncbi:MAG: ThuA domain-containing protein, partial [Verrucomicrobiae bacterium]|nr:ThuA domain-containing protein [Verrucomicrobiae bacterium]